MSENADAIAVLRKAMEVLKAERQSCAVEIAKGATFGAPLRFTAIQEAMVRLVAVQAAIDAIDRATEPVDALRERGGLHVG
jgi:hypothetical protein